MSGQTPAPPLYGSGWTSTEVDVEMLTVDTTVVGTVSVDVRCINDSKTVDPTVRQGNDQARHPAAEEAVRHARSVY
jgi:hypothetical protein